MADIDTACVREQKREPCNSAVTVGFDPPGSLKNFDFHTQVVRVRIRVRWMARARATAQARVT